jgi:glycosyltransferase involved in cell wall biosynthesis
VGAHPVALPVVPDKILVFIPCYNCEPQIGRVLAQFRAVPAGLVHEILVVDNRSRDETLRAAVEGMVAVTDCAVTVVRNVENYSLGGSHKVAFAYAEEHGFSHVVVLHGDDQGAIADVVPLLQRGMHREYDACLGARFMRGSRLLGYSRFRTFGNAVFNALFTLAARRRVWDLGSGLNVFARAAFDTARVRRYPDDLRFNVYLLLGLIDAGRRLHFFPISWREDDQVSNVRMVSQALKTATITSEYVLDRVAFREGEHREVPRAEYRFELVARREAGAASGGAAAR